MAERRYSVSPNFRPKIFGPNPRENLRTLTPTQRAAKKCPSSWNATNTPRTIRNHHAFCNNNQTVSGDQVKAVNTVYAPSCRSSRMLKKSPFAPAQPWCAETHPSPSFVLASLRGSTYRSVCLASSLVAALLDGLFEHPVHYSGTITASHRTKTSVSASC